MITKTDKLILEPSDKQSQLSGGTINILPDERKKASFVTKDLIDFLNGGEAATKRRKFIEAAMSKDIYEKYNLTRPELLKVQIKDFIDIHKKYANFKPTRQDISTMSESSVGFSSLGNSHNWFLMTIVGQGNLEQQQYWTQKILKFEIVGAYAQTELGHGSNVRGLQTTAEFDPNTKELILNTPTLQSIKWWPGALGRVSTHVVLYAQLISNKKELGVHVFMMQIRDENHKALPGITIGDLGTKMGDNANDTGFMILENVRIPFTSMLSKYHKLNEHGELVTVLKASPQIHYTTMTSTRAKFVNTAGARLAQSATIAIRYSCLRKQGFKSFENGIPYNSPEYQIVDHKIQQYRLFKQLAFAYALKFAGKWMMELVNTIEGGEWGAIKSTEGLKEIATTSAGMKSLSTLLACNGIEDLRKCCGGNGYLLNSGIAAMFNDYVWQVTAEGDMTILGLLTSKSLHQEINNLIKGEQTKGVYEYFNDLNKGKSLLTLTVPSKAKSSVEFKNLDYLVELFKYRSIYRNFTTNQEINELVNKQGVKLQEAFNIKAVDSLRAAYSHCYYLILVNFVKKIKEAKNIKIESALTRLCILMACSHMIDDNWGDILVKDQFRFIKITINEMLSEIRPDCIALCDGFDYPDNILKSTIGKYDGNVYESLFDAAQNSVLNRQEVFKGYAEVLKPHLDLNLLSHGNTRNLPIKAKF